jgi:hypothetical protein
MSVAGPNVLPINRNRLTPETLKPGGETRRKEPMKVLVATRATQGARATDSSNCVDGELVWMIDPCPMSQRDPDGECPCGRSFSGMSSLGSTTTAMVRELQGFSVADYESALLGCFQAKGWCNCCTAHPLNEQVSDLMDLAASLPEGAVIERRVNYVEVRALVRSGNDETPARG